MRLWRVFLCRCSTHACIQKSLGSIPSSGLLKKTSVHWAGKGILPESQDNHCPSEPKILDSSSLVCSCVEEQQGEASAFLPSMGLQRCQEDYPCNCAAFWRPFQETSPLKFQKKQFEPGKEGLMRVCLWKGLESDHGNYLFV